MSCLTIADLIDAQACDLFDIARAAVWGDATLRFEDKDKVLLATVTTCWMADVITSEAEGIPDLNVEVLPQSAVTEAMLDVSCRFLVLKGRRYEKGPYEYRTDAPARHHLRFGAIGETA